MFYNLFFRAVKQYNKKHIELKKKKSDFVIKNNFNNNSIKKNVKRVFEKILLNV